MKFIEQECIGAGMPEALLIFPNKENSAVSAVLHIH